MLVAITGAGGFIGKKLISHFTSKGIKTLRIPRIDAETKSSELAEYLSGVDVIINLAGAPVLGRWTKTYKKILFDSRIITTGKIVEAISLMDTKPELMISASAIGIYSSQGFHTEKSFRLSDDYLGEICKAWEAEANKAVLHTRLAIIRLGIVLGKEGGALKRILPLFKLGFGGKIASGNQGFSWIHIADLLNAIEYIIENKNLSGTFNFTAPDVTDNKGFTKMLAKLVHRQAVLPVPVSALKMILGEGVVAIAGGQFAPPEHLLESGFTFSYPNLESALKEIVSVSR